MYIPEQLKEIAEKVENGSRIKPITVRTLVSWFWDSKRRGTFINYSISKALKKLEIETIPDFASAFIDARLEFRKIEKPVRATKKQNDLDLLNLELTTPVDEVLNIDDPTFRISRLEAANKKLIAINPEATLSEAITQMMTYDFSQLPVMQSEKRGLKGVISWKSIGQKLSLGNSSTKVSDLMESSYQLLLDSTSLFKALPLIIEHDYVLVQNKSQEICGIITASDLSLQFKQLTEPFLLVAEIENHLRQILNILSLEELKIAKDPSDENRTIENIFNLTFGEYLRMIQKPELWIKLKLKIDRKTFCDHLETIKDIRNNIMHFDPDGLEQDQIDSLRNFVRLLQTLRNLK